MFQMLLCALLHSMQHTTCSTPHCTTPARQALWCASTQGTPQEEEQVGSQQLDLLIGRAGVWILKVVVDHQQPLPWWQAASVPPHSSIVQCVCGVSR